MANIEHLRFVDVVGGEQCDMRKKIVYGERMRARWTARAGPTSPVAMYDRMCVGGEKVQ